MIPSALNYGKLKRPEPEAKRLTAGKGRIEDVLHAAYRNWLNAVGYVKMALPSDGECDDAYNEATALLFPFTQQLQAITPRQLNSFIRKISDDFQPHGIFSSAAINLSGVSAVHAPPNARFAGYRLKKGKTMLIDEASSGDFAGSFSEGTIVNLSNFVTILASYASGVAINYGAWAHEFARQAASGVQVYAGKK